MTDLDPTLRDQRERLLRLVTKAFYRELTNYGVARNEILTVANHLLEHVVKDPTPSKAVSLAGEFGLSLGMVRDRWAEHQQLSVDEVTITPFSTEVLGIVVDWLEDPNTREAFVPPLPSAAEEILAYFRSPTREYFQISFRDQLVGLIGAENIDLSHGRLEMKKLIGSPSFRGRGIGTRGTFCFLYHAFVIRQIHKVYVHSPDTNLSNLNLNSRLGFELEGILLEEFSANGKHYDVVRMALLRPLWLALFGD